jgi:hypothetical protein
VRSHLENIVTHASRKINTVSNGFRADTIQYILLIDKTGIHINPCLVEMAG